MARLGFRAKLECKVRRAFKDRLGLREALASRGALASLVTPEYKVKLA
jgi:hypothetical protein